MRAFRNGCPCGGEYVQKFVEVRGGGEVLTDVRQGVCPDCGSRVYDRPTLERIEAIVWGRWHDPLLGRVRQLSDFAAGASDGQAHGTPG